jgi:hypothetical protein
VANCQEIPLQKIQSIVGSKGKAYDQAYAYASAQPSSSAPVGLIGHYDQRWLVWNCVIPASYARNIEITGEFVGMTQFCSIFTKWG